MRKTFLCVLFALVSIFCLTLASACNSNEPSGPVANAELDEYNEIVNQMKGIFTQNNTSTPTKTAKTTLCGLSTKSSQEDAISSMFTLMDSDSSKKETLDMDYYAYGIDFSTMTARIAGYAANNYFKVSSFYDINILMDYGSNTKINALVRKDENVIKTYLFTTFKNSFNQTYKEYDYTEINFTSQDDFYIVVLDYTYDEQNNLTSKTMIYASSKKDFFLISGNVNELSSGVVFFDKGGDSPAYIIQSNKSDTIDDLFSLLNQNFALSNEDKLFIENLYNEHNYSINYKQVIKAKTDLGVIINMEDEEIEIPMGFVSNKNAEDLVGRKTLQAFVDDGKSVNGTTLTIPDEFNYLSGGINFYANIDTLVIPSSIKGVVVYDRLWNYSILDDSLCYYDCGDNYDNGMYRAWGGSLVSFRTKPNTDFSSSDIKPFKKYILLDDNGIETTETDAFVLDDVGNLWIKDSKGNKNYLWGFVSEPSNDSDTIFVPSPTFVYKDRYIQVEHFTCQDFFQGLYNIGKADEYSSHFKHAIIDGYVIEQAIPEMGILPGFNILRNTFYLSFEYEETGMQGLKWNLETLTINNIIDGAHISLIDVFCSESGKFNEYGYPSGDMVCQAKINKVILNGDFDKITYTNGFCEIPRPTIIPGNNGSATVIPNDNYEIVSTYAISEEYELNGRENAYFTQDSVIYGKKIVEIYGNEEYFPAYPNAETLIIKSSVSKVSINTSLFEIGVYKMPKDKKLTIEFENVAGIDFSYFHINDLSYGDSDRVEKFKFNISELNMQNLLKLLEWDPYASWLSEVVNSSKYEIEYAEYLNGEQEFLTNYRYDNYGYVSLKEDSTLNNIIVNDEFLTLIKTITGKSLNEIVVYYGQSQTDIKLIIDVSQAFINENNGEFPNISSFSTAEIDSKMNSIDNLIGVLDCLSPNDGAKLIYNGTKEEFTSQLGNVDCDYIAKLLYNKQANFGEISFSDNETLYNDIYNKSICYEDERIKIIITFEEYNVVNYSFEDKLHKNVAFSSSNGYGSDNDENNGWYVQLRCSYYGYEETSYNGVNVEIPNFALTIYYYYGLKEDGTFNYVYGTYEEHYRVPFKIHMLPSNITLL